MVDDDWPPKFKVTPEGTAGLFLTAHCPSANGRITIPALVELFQLYYDEGFKEGNKITEIIPNDVAEAITGLKHIGGINAQDAIKVLERQQGDFNIAILQRDAARKRIEELEEEMGGWKAHVELGDEKIKELEAQCKQYEAIGKRIAAQDGNWLMLHAGAMDWLHGEFAALAERNK